MRNFIVLCNGCYAPVHAAKRLNPGSRAVAGPLSYSDTGTALVRNDREAAIDFKREFARGY